jgi:hypothetical protein
MRRMPLLLVAVVMLAGVVVGVVGCMVPSSRHADGEAAPIFGVKIPPGYRDWRLIYVAHEEGSLKMRTGMNQQAMEPALGKLVIAGNFVTRSLAIPRWLAKQRASRFRIASGRP